MNKSILFCGAIVSALLFTSNSADAGLALEFTWAGASSPLTIADDGAGDLATPVPNSILSIDASGATTGGDFQYNVNVTSDSPGTSTLSMVQDVGVRIVNTSGAPLVITLAVTDDMFLLPGGPGSLLNVRTEISTSAGFEYGSGDSASGASSIDGVLTSPDVLLSEGNTNNDFDLHVLARGASPFEIGNRIVISLDTGSAFQFQLTTTVTPTPEAASLIAWGSCVAIGLLFAYRRKRTA